MKNRHFLRRLRQSALDRMPVQVRYRFKGDSKDRVVEMKNCEVTHFRQKLGKVESFKVRSIVSVKRKIFEYSSLTPSLFQYNIL